MLEQTANEAAAPLSSQRAFPPDWTVIGHRGARGHAPENTLLSIDTAIRLGAPWVEFDVQRHPTGELLVFHDLTLGRTTDGHGLLAAQSLETLRRLDAGAGQRIPTLNEVLDLVGQRIGVNIELKTAEGTATAVAEALASRIAAGWPLEKLLVSSFHLPELRAFKQLLPQVPIGALIAGVPLDGAACAVALGAATLNIAADFIDPRLVADAHAHGIRVFVYTVNEPEELRALPALGIDGVFTDFPDRALALASG